MADGHPFEASDFYNKIGQEATSKMHVAQKKSRPKAALNFNLMIADQAAINAGFDLRR
jgi:hypothetical protein